MALHYNLEVCEIEVLKLLARTPKIKFIQHYAYKLSENFTGPNYWPWATA